MHLFAEMVEARLLKPDRPVELVEPRIGPVSGRLVRKTAAQMNRRKTV
jgi:hypothetical protein